jgi:hypothetical protein
LKKFYRKTVYIYNTFNNCIALAAVTIGANVATIGNYAFYNCAVLTALEIPAGVMTGSGSIGEYAFASCAALASLTIKGSAGVTVDMDRKVATAFNECGNLKTLAIDGGVTVSNLDFSDFPAARL